MKAPMPKPVLPRGLYRAFERASRIIIPTREVTEGRVNIAQNLETYFARFPGYAARLRVPFILLQVFYHPLPFPLLHFFRLLDEEDRNTFAKVFVSLGYYGDGNGEAELPVEQRRIWRRLGYPGPKPENWEPPGEEAKIDPAEFEDKLPGTDALKFVEQLERTP